ncbi:unnamed protein product [Ostreobium quekettii]|uniref:Uncharacterized protein n=1 Tax=Ostreobium quekettii TaxID=121088 RepID=A0A8S1JFG1_9CHLO|nr:unnamed protein product [Ostreobium quekettii]|eukprot:evm.model.scf_962.6 EVM.evm.TU.scf_962.6   scf_962:52396-53939(+)
MAKSRDDDFDPSRFSAARLCSHALQKGFQAGAVVGAAAVLPTLAFLAYRKTGSPAMEPGVVMEALGKSGLMGTGLSGILVSGKMIGMDREGLEDRVYRLHYNEGQKRVDRFCQAGGLLGAIAAAFLVNKSPMVVVGGAAAGAFLGVVAHGTTAAKDSTPNKMMHEVTN